MTMLEKRILVRSVGTRNENGGKLKGGINLNAIFPPLDMALMEISRSRFKQSKNSMLIP